MEYEINFKCTGDNLEEIPQSIIDNKGLNFPTVHTNKGDIINLAQELKRHKKDIICRVPFCTTVEAEALGGKIKLGNEKTGPRVESYVFTNTEELEKVKEINLNRGRIKEVLDSVQLLSKQSEIVALNVEGPLTIISSLIDPKIFYKGIRKNRDRIDKFIKVIEDSIVMYILEGIKRGARIISYGDPAGALDIVGPRIYKEISGKITYNILKRVEPHLGNTIIHLCGKTSTAFENLDLSKVEAVEYDENFTYGEALKDILQNHKDIKIIGHSCIKRTSLKLKNSVIWNIKLS